MVIIMHKIIITYNQITFGFIFIIIEKCISIINILLLIVTLCKNFIFCDICVNSVIFLRINEQRVVSTCKQYLYFQ